MSIFKRFPLLLFAFVSGALPSFAGSAINLTSLVYSPAAAISATPTLSQTMLIALALILPVLAFRTLRNIPSTKPFAAIILAGGLAAVEAVTGYHFFPKANAQASTTTLNLSLSGGGTATANLLASTVTVTNTSGQTQIIRSITMTTSALGKIAIPTPGTGNCVVGTSLAPNASCLLKYQEVLPG